MRMTRSDLKPFLRGYLELVQHVLFEESKLWLHLLYLVAIPFYPLLWPALYLWLPQGDQNDQNREDS